MTRFAGYVRVTFVTVPMSLGVRPLSNVVVRRQGFEPRTR
ncbi:MAG: hypothetical protein QOE41_833 [Mycobacterium sp.]|jgi:hypothetical protein|nr:hypothetical protein [Mycobacterium sp.]MDT5131522.1 hypothetical protein [Mycobacterium sp.]